MKRLGMLLVLISVSMFTVVGCNGKKDAKKTDDAKKTTTTDDTKKDDTKKTETT